MALAAFLNLVWQQETSETADTETQVGESMAKKYNFESYQRVIEGGLLSALEKPRNEEEA